MADRLISRRHVLLAAAMAALAASVLACEPQEPDEEGLPEPPVTVADEEVVADDGDGDDAFVRDPRIEQEGRPLWDSYGEEGQEAGDDEDVEGILDEEPASDEPPDVEGQPAEEGPPVEEDALAEEEPPAEGEPALDEPPAVVEEPDGAIAASGPRFPHRKFLLPFRCGKKVRVTQGNNTNFSHQGTSRWAYDFGVPSGTKLRAMRRGKVTYVRNSTKPGDPCFSGGGPSCITKANYVVIKHGDGTSTIYAHVNKVTVKKGQRVRRGQVVARSGGTGYSTGPHAHVARMANCGSSHCQSIKMRFADVGGNGRPASGQWVTSKNGCD